MNARIDKLTNLEILRAQSEPGPRYSIFKIFTLYVMCLQFKISEEFICPFSRWLDRARRAPQGNIRGIGSNILIFVKYLFRI